MFFRYCIDKWNKRNPQITNAMFVYKSKKSNITEIVENSFYDVHSPIWVKLLSRLRLEFTHLNKHKFRHSFSGTVNSICPCWTDVETTEHFHLRCHRFSIQRFQPFDYLYRLVLSFSKFHTKEKIPSRSKLSGLSKDVIKLINWSF